MFSIEEVAHICGVRIEYIKKLIDCGYMKEDLFHFNMKDVEKIRLIISLESFNICKSDIEMVMENEIDLDGILKVKICEIENEIERQRKLIEDINRTRDSLAKGFSLVSNITMTKPTLAEQSEMWICSVRQNIHIDAINSLLKKLHKKIDVYNLKTIGSLIRIIHHKEPNTERVDIELGFPVKTTKKANYEILRLVPSRYYLCVNIIAEYKNISFGYSNLYKWIRENNYEVLGTSLEYFEDVTISEDGETTNIQLDIEKEPEEFNVKLCIPVGVRGLED